MPRNSSGIYTLPDGYKAVTGETILASQHNPPLEDIATALTGSLPRNGSAPMTGPIRAPDGDVSAPAYSFVNSPTWGLIKTATGIAIVIDGQTIATFGPGGFIGLPVGTPIPILDDTLPPLCVWGDGRNLYRTSYPLLFAKYGTRFGAGNGTTTFGTPDYRGKGIIGCDNTGGTDAGRLTGVPVVSGNRTTVGSTLGANLHTLTVAQMPAHDHPGSTAAANGSHRHDTAGYTAIAGGVGFGGLVAQTVDDAQTGFAGNHTHDLTITSQGGGSAHNNTGLSLTHNIAIYAGE